MPVKPRILVIEDAQEVRDMLLVLLQNDYQTATARSGSEGFNWVHSAGEAERPDLILLDVMMPGMNGYEVMGQLASEPRTADIPVIFLTALSSVAEEQLGLDLGATDYITKPISPPILLARVRMHLERSSNARRLKHLSEQLSRYLAPQVYKSLFDGSRQAQIQTQRKPLTVFFSDIKNFTAATASWPPDKVTVLLNQYFAEMSHIAAEYGATLDKFIGDAIVIFFGDPHSLGVERDARQCVQMAVAMQQRMPALQQLWRNTLGIDKPFEIRIGIHSGLCDVGNFGSNLRMEYTIIGREVNLAARLEQAARPGEVLISSETAALLGGDATLRAEVPVEAKGFTEPIAVFSVGFAPGAGLPEVALVPVQPQLQTKPGPARQLPAVIAGFDLDVGLARALGQRPLYATLLQRFALNRRDTGQQIRQAIALGDWAQAELLSHSLRGVAAQLGATTLPHHAGALEQALRLHEGTPAATIEALVLAVETSLGAVIHALELAWAEVGASESTP